MKILAGKLAPDPSQFLKKIYKKKFEEASILVWTNFDSFTISR